MNLVAQTSGSAGSRNLPVPCLQRFRGSKRDSFRRNLTPALSSFCGEEGEKEQCSDVLGSQGRNFILAPIPILEANHRHDRTGRASCLPAMASESSSPPLGKKAGMRGLQPHQRDPTPARPVDSYPTALESLPAMAKRTPCPTSKNSFRRANPFAPSGWLLIVPISRFNDAIAVPDPALPSPSFQTLSIRPLRATVLLTPPAPWGLSPTAAGRTGLRLSISPHIERGALLRANFAQDCDNLID